MFTERIDVLRNDLKNAFKELVQSHGEDGEFHVFNFSSDDGCILDCSTIDKIVISRDDVIFFYNENENDYEYFEEFTLNGLAKYYDSLINAIENEENN